MFVRVGIGPWYHNTVAIMAEAGFERILSEPMAYGILRDRLTGKNPFGTIDRFALTALEKVRVGWSLLRAWSSDVRGTEHYAHVLASDHFATRLSTRGHATLNAVYGPWVGVDWTRASLHHVAQFFRKNLMPGYGSTGGEGWRVLRGPSNQMWFDPWVASLRNRSVRVRFGVALKHVVMNGDHVVRAELSEGHIEADHYVLAITPFASTRKLFRTDKALRAPLTWFEPLCADGPHVQVSFQLSFRELIVWPCERAAVLLADSEFNLTLFAEEQVWTSSAMHEQGDIRSLWTGTACVATVPGRVFGKPILQCTKDEFVIEIRRQLADSLELQAMLQKANGRALHEFTLVHVAVWEDWDFNGHLLKAKQPKWVTSTHTQQWQPPQRTYVDNLSLAGSHTQSSADLWSVEGAVESGLLAANIILERYGLPQRPVISQYWSPPLRFIARLDNLAYRAGLPHLLDILLVLLLFVFLLFALSMFL